MIPQSGGPAGRWPVDRRTEPMQCAVQWGVSGGQSCSCRARDPRGGGRPVIALQTAAQLNCRWRAGPLGRPPAAAVLDLRLGAEDSCGMPIGLPTSAFHSCSTGGVSYREAIGRQSRPAWGSGASKAGRRAGPWSMRGAQLFASLVHYALLHYALLQWAVLHRAKTDGSVSPSTRPPLLR
jgi:hypothetical protein